MYAGRTENVGSRLERAAQPAELLVRERQAPVVEPLEVGLLVGGERIDAAAVGAVPAFSWRRVRRAVRY